MTWYEFFLKFQGYSIKRRSDDRIMDKNGMFHKFRKDKKGLLKLLIGEHEEYIKVQKDDFDINRFIGLKDGAHPFRVYKYCEGRKEHKVRNSNEYIQVGKTAAKKPKTYRELLDDKNDIFLKTVKWESRYL